jgi:hypothetical protein
VNAPALAGELTHPATAGADGAAPSRSDRKRIDNEIPDAGRNWFRARIDLW